jgi:hypothetical protein
MLDIIANEPTTPALLSDIERAIRACDRFINIEGPRSADLRPPDVAKDLAFYMDYRAALQSTLDARLEALFGNL